MSENPTTSRSRGHEEMGGPVGGLTLHVQLRKSHWRELVSDLRSPGLSRLKSAAIVRIAGELVRAPGARWICLTERSTWLSAELLWELEQKEETDRYHVCIRAMQGTFREALAQDLGFNGQPCFGEELETQPDSPFAVCFSRESLDGGGVPLDWEACGGLVWRTPGSHSKAPWETVWSRVVNESGNVSSTSVIVCSEKVAPMLASLEMNLLVPEHGIDIGEQQPGTLDVIWICVALTLDLCAALLLRLRANICSTTQIKGFFYDHESWPEHCYVVSSLFGTPQVSMHDGFWEVRSKSSLFEKFKSNRAILQPLVFGEASRNNRLKGGTALIGGAADHFEQLLQIISNLPGALVPSDVLVLDTGAIGEQVLLACARWGVSYRNVANMLHRRGDAGRFLEACSLLPEGTWTIVSLACPHSSQVANLAVAGPPVKGVIRSLKDATNTGRMMTLGVCMAVTGVLEESELAKMRKLDPFPTAVLQLEINLLLTESWLQVFDHCRSIADETIDLAMAVIALCALRSGTDVELVGSCPAKARRVSELIREGRPPLHVEAGHTAIVLLTHDFDAAEMERLSGWNWTADSKICLVTTEANVTLGRKLALDWSPADVALFTGLTHGKTSTVRLEELGAGASFTAVAIYIIESDAEPCPGAVFPSEEELGILVPEGSGPTVARAASIIDLEVGTHGELVQMRTRKGVKTSRYNAKSIGWLEA